MYFSKLPMRRRRVGLAGVAADLSYYSGTTKGWPDFILSPFCGDFAASFAADTYTPVCRAFHAKNSAELAASLPVPPVTGIQIPVPVLNPDGSAANPATAVDDLIRANKARQDLLNLQFFEGLEDPATPPDKEKGGGLSPLLVVVLAVLGIGFLNVVTGKREA